MPSISGKRLDLYKNFKFVVKFAGKDVAGVSKVSGLKRTTEVIEHRTGGDPSTVYKSPGQSKYDPITLERGVSKDTDFEQWANKVWALGGSPEVSLADFRKDITIEVRDEAGQPKGSYNVFGCWVSEYQALPDLDASANAVAIEYIKIENEGWERAS
ncbi:MAG: phage tail protein [Nostoc sp. NMS1]|uniref:Phage tail protein n=1 Tax=Nostoc punctiforme NIES-2108 TaxID=1356359 RepID=A0A367R960_NOSPU|nr:phage tail protein [Nostoc sp. NMS1]MBN3907913.1 phage tail protein [Nostoc sp. NMS1]RCJ32410.1 phage tail protein [Nostoc punctiforme NIES-2108]